MFCAYLSIGAKLGTGGRDARSAQGGPIVAGLTHFADLSETSPDAVRSLRRAILVPHSRQFVELYDFVIFGLFAALGLKIPQNRYSASA